jgi:hypothetical protein
MRERPCRSQRPDRVVEVALEAALAAGLLGRRRVLDSTPLYDAVATMDTITLIRSAIRGLLATAEADLAALLRAATSSGDDYARGGKPVIDWDDTRPGRRWSTPAPGTATPCWWSSTASNGRPSRLPEAMRLLATVLGHLETGPGRNLADRPEGYPSPRYRQNSEAAISGQSCAGSTF